MNRLGFRPEEALAALARLRDCAAVAPAIRLMTHFASADEPTDPATRAQIDRFAARRRRASSCERCFCNSAGVLAWPEAHAEWIRPGVMLYGVSPLTGRTGRDEGLRPVMTLTTRLIAVKQVPAGRGGRLCRHLAGRGRQPDRHRRHRLWRRLPAPRRLRHAGPGRRQAGRRSSAGSPWTCWRSTSRRHPEAAVGTPGHPLGRGPAGRDGRRPRRHHRLRAALRPHRPRPRPAPGPPARLTLRRLARPRRRMAGRGAEPAPVCRSRS